MNMKSQKLRKYAGIFSVMCGGLLISVPAISQTAVAQESNSPTLRQTNSRVNPCPSVFYEEPFNNRVLVPEGCPANAITQRLANQGILSTARAQTQSPGTTTSSPYQTGLGVGGETPQTNANRGQLNPCPQVYYQEPFNSRNLVPEGCPPNTFSQGRQSQGATSNQGTSVNPQVSTGGTTTQTPLPSQQQAPSATIALANGLVNINLVNDTAAKVTYQVIGDTAARSLPGKSNVMLQNISAPVTVTFEREDGGLLTVTPQPSSEQQGMLEVRLNEATDVAQDRKAMRIQSDGSIFLN
ncbi:hypothetical protein H6G76_06050 [Nostoc sp. FACHB-152]|uniref:hypothetical protein n=1 Tax=unclassified Nostoc TaxID=2593658 RepID=UPI001685F0F1|nr:MULTISPECIES: hypothetical protein [unclassified Nostoc]MBD2446735.1 hypothetical protein [Nostoc sp. FACHB-152]MBD2466583.1 hypothetical protein [Nostoc sp. FACHB-145]